MIYDMGTFIKVRDKILVEMILRAFRIMLRIEKIVDFLTKIAYGFAY